jgi:1,4-alpha-glucan branching enzyme
LPSGGNYRVILNTDAAVYDGSSSVELDSIEAESVPLHLRPYSALIDLPPLSTIWLAVPRADESAGV